MNIEIERIRIGPGRRAVDSGKVAALMESIRDAGLLTPIAVTPGNVLVAGAHRIEACRRLGWTTIPAMVVDYRADGERVQELAEESGLTVAVVRSILLKLAEIDENLVRNNGTEQDRLLWTADRKKHYVRIHPETKRGTAGGKASGAARRGERTTPGSGVVRRTSSFVDDTSAKTGRGRSTVHQDVQIAEGIAPDVHEAIRGTPVANNRQELRRLAEKSHEEQRAVAEKLRSGAAKSVRAAANLQVADTIRREPQPMPQGPFRVIVVDPPWRYEKRAQDPTHRAGLPYPDMSIEDICALPVGQRAHKDAILWLWTTNAFMRDAYRCVDAWGFAERTILTWVKDRIGTGDWLRGQTEHCILAIRGRPTVTLAAQSTVLQAPTREHSRKPEEFYRLVEGLCPGSKLEMFGREGREGWTTWGGEATKFDGA